MSKVVSPRNVPQYEQLRTANRVIAVLFRKDDEFLPEFDQLSIQFPKVQFVDIDMNNPKWQTLGDAKGIKTFPTVKIYKDRELASTVNASHEKVCENVRKLDYGRGVIIDKPHGEYYQKCVRCESVV